jgi:hypothetical protein
MPFRFRFALLLAVLAACAPLAANADRKTVCTITVNSPDERETFRRWLPAGDYDFVELVEKGRPDWLASACRKNVRCDVLLISGHFDGGDVFYTDRFDQSESLPTDELDRVSCSDSCPGLFSQLKEVYLFGCNTLNAQPMRTASPEIARSLVRSGYSAADAQQLAAQLASRYGESNRDRMRQIFHDVPVIYGFSSKAPLGRSAGPTLERFFQSGSGADVATGRPSAKLVGLFAAASMTVTSGLTASDPNAAFRADVCRLADDRQSVAQKLEFVHSVLGREMAEVRLFLDHLEKYVASLADVDRQSPQVARALDSIAHDERARTRYLDFARDADEPATRARMTALARGLGWLTPQAERAEIVQMIRELIARDAVGASEVDLACALNRDGALAGEAGALRVPANATKTGQAAVLACLGDNEAHARVLRALVSSNEADVSLAQVYLRHRPIADVSELRTVAAAIARMPSSDAQVRALDTLAQHRLSDRASLDEVAKLFRLAKSVSVQRAIAGILIRGDYRSIANADLVRALRESRLKSPDGEDMIDILIRRVQAAI